MTSNPSSEGNNWPADVQTRGIQATVVRYEESADECTLHPTDASVSELLAVWITAEEGSYVDAEQWR